MSDILCTEIHGHGVKNDLDQTGTVLMIWMFIFTYSLTLSFSLGTKKVVNNSYTVHNNSVTVWRRIHMFLDILVTALMSDSCCHTTTRSLVWKAKPHPGEPTKTAVHTNCAENV